MTVEPGAAPIKVDAATSRTTAGADFYPRRVVDTGIVHWFYGPRLIPEVAAATWCSDTFAGVFPQDGLREDLTGGTPCPRCNAKWSMT